jgi:Kelch motif protein
MQAGLVAALIALGVVAALVGRGHSGKDKGAAETGPPPPRAAVQPIRLSSSVVGHLSAPEQDAAVAQTGPASAVLLGGLTAADTSRTDVVVLHGAREARHDVLPAAVHDAAAVRLGRSVYLFGGGNFTTSDAIVRVSLSGRPAQQVGKLPRPLSDVAAATVGSTAFIVGGYDGTNASDEILAWRPGHRVHVVGKLPHPLRYAAVAALGRNLYIAGGSTPTGASHDVLAFDTTTHKLTLASRLPRPTTHAAAASFGCCVYVIGGRQEQVGTPTRRIFAVQPGRRRIHTAGRLPVPLSDLGAVAQRRRILAVGGRTSAGTVDTIVELRPQR